MHQLIVIVEITTFSKSLTTRQAGGMGGDGVVTYHMNGEFILGFIVLFTNITLKAVGRVLLLWSKLIWIVLK